MRKVGLPKEQVDLIAPCFAQSYAEVAARNEFLAFEL